MTEPLAPLTPERVAEIRELATAWVGVATPVPMSVRDLVDLCDAIDRLRASLAAARAEAAKLREALEWYANKNTDYGQVAVRALAAPPSTAATPEGRPHE